MFYILFFDQSNNMYWPANLTWLADRCEFFDDERWIDAHLNYVCKSVVLGAAFFRRINSSRDNRPKVTKEDDAAALKNMEASSGDSWPFPLFRWR